MTRQSEVGIVELFENDRVASLVRVALESRPPEGLLYHLLVGGVAALLPDAQHGAELGKPRVRQNFTILRRQIEIDEEEWESGVTCVAILTVVRVSTVSQCEAGALLNIISQKYILGGSRMSSLSHLHTGQHSLLTAQSCWISEQEQYRTQYYSPGQTGCHLPAEGSL